MLPSLEAKFPPPLTSSSTGTYSLCVADSIMSICEGGSTLASSAAEHHTWADFHCSPETSDVYESATFTSRCGALRDVKSSPPVTTEGIVYPTSLLASS